MSLSSSDPEESDTTHNKAHLSWDQSVKVQGQVPENVSCIYSEQFAPSVLPEREARKCLKRESSKALKLGIALYD